MMLSQQPDQLAIWWHERSATLEQVWLDHTLTSFIGMRWSHEKVPLLVFRAYIVKDTD